jgi:hypothetical protein
VGYMHIDAKLLGYRSGMRCIYKHIHTIYVQSLLGLKRTCLCNFVAKMQNRSLSFSEFRKYHQNCPNFHEI